MILVISDVLYSTSLLYNQNHKTVLVELKKKRDVHVCVNYVCERENALMRTVFSIYMKCV